MGLIRFLLAITVVINHAGPLYGLVFTDAYIAIKIFFIISGFYMALILTEKYRGKDSYSLFISNRMLRLFPTYWFVLSFSVAASLLCYAIFHSSLVLGPWFNKIGSLDVSSLIAIAVANLTIIGQDSLFFTYVNPFNGSLTYSPDALYQSTPAWTFLAIPQAWTLSLEIMFYLIAPYLLKKRLGVIIALCAGSFLLRAFLTTMENVPADPWKLRFFPSELGFFLLGIISYVIYAKLKHSNPPVVIQKYVFAGLLGTILLYQFLPDGLTKELFIYAVATLSLPFIFLYTKNMKHDRMIGELSYPVYISHWVVLFMLGYLLDVSHFTAVTILATILFSMFINRFIVNKVERYRQKRVATQGSFLEETISAKKRGILHEII